MVEALETAIKPRLARIATDAATAANDDGNFMSEVAEAAEVRRCTREGNVLPAAYAQSCGALRQVETPSNCLSGEALAYRNSEHSFCQPQ
jgi:hypothetical protein